MSNIVKRFNKRAIVAALADLKRNIENCPPRLTALILEGFIMNGDSEDEAIRRLAEFEVMTSNLLEAAKKLPDDYIAEAKPSQ